MMRYARVEVRRGGLKPTGKTVDWAFRVGVAASPDATYEDLRQELTESALDAAAAHWACDRSDLTVIEFDLEED